MFLFFTYLTMRFYEYDIKEFDEILRRGLRAKVVFKIFEINSAAK